MLVEMRSEIEGERTGRSILEKSDKFMSFFSSKNVYGFINIYIFTELYIYSNKNWEFLFHKEILI